MSHHAEAAAADALADLEHSQARDQPLHHDASLLRHDVIIIV